MTKMIIITVHCGHQTKHVNITREENAEFYGVKATSKHNSLFFTSNLQTLSFTEFIRRF